MLHVCQIQNLSILFTELQNALTEPQKKEWAKQWAELAWKKMLAAVERSRARAWLAANEIAADLENFNLDPEATRDGRQILHLIGHSRGGAVSAWVAKLLTQRGCRIDQYTGLDAYSTDWPEPSGLVGDCDVAAVLATASVGRRVNYRVERGLAEIGLSWFQTGLESLADGGKAPANAPATLEILLRTFADWRAPERPGFENKMLRGYGTNLLSHHLNVPELYLGSAAAPGNQRYILDSFLGQYRSVPQGGAKAAALPRRVESDASRAIAGIAKTAAATDPRTIDSNFTDGGFDSLGAQLANATALPDPGIDDPALSLWISAVKNQTSQLQSEWGSSGPVKLINDAGNWKLEMTQSTNTSIRQGIVESCFQRIVCSGS